MQRHETVRLKFIATAADQKVNTKPDKNKAGNPVQSRAGRGSRKKANGQTGILRAAGTGQPAFKMPESSLLKHLSSARHFLPPSDADVHLRKTASVSAAAEATPEQEPQQTVPEAAAAHAMLSPPPEAVPRRALPRQALSHQEALVACRLRSGVQQKPTLQSGAALETRTDARVHRSCL